MSLGSIKVSGFGRVNGFRLIFPSLVLIGCGGQIHGFGCYGFMVVRIMDSWWSNSLVGWIFFFSIVVVYGYGQ